MKIIDVYIQHPILSLNKPFSYLYEGSQEIVVGTRVEVSFHNRKIVGYVANVKYTDLTKVELEENHGFKYEFIINIVDDKPILNEELINLSMMVASYYYAPIISVLKAMLPESLRPNKSSLKATQIQYDSYFIATDLLPSALTNKQQEVYDFIKSNKEVLKSSLKTTTTKTLIEKGFLKIIKKEKYRYAFEKVEQLDAYQLTKEQAQAFNILNESKFETNLLEGVTGSGKTQVYLALVDKCLNESKQAIILVPEISLTPLMVEVFMKRFGENIAVLHSGLTVGQKYDEYRRISSGQVSIVIGARSAIFAPLTNIGLIVIDEEHSDTYKANDLPFYHALTVAQMRAKMHNCKIILGSATPTLESRSRALKNVYGYAKISQKHGKNTQLETIIVDMNDKNNHSLESPYLSKKLIEAINQKISNKEQVMLLVNRRGYASIIRCKKCGNIERCPICANPLTYHQHDNTLKCHHCATSTPFTNICTTCISNELKISGFGTQKAVEQISSIFDHAKILRLDSDKGKTEKQIKTILNKFALGEADILIGTQMIAKGHDFHNVTLVGIINADAGLYQHTYKASENVFNLIAQAVGRTGRGEKKGLAIIQTNEPNNNAIVRGSTQDYDSFYNDEMRLRRERSNPPYTFNTAVIVSGDDHESLTKNIKIFKNELIDKLKDNIEIIGPSVSKKIYVARKYERRILIKYSNYFLVKPHLLKAIKPLVEKSAFRVVIDVDCIEF